MFNIDTVEALQGFIKAQDDRKSLLGKPNFAHSKLLEEGRELKEELFYEKNATSSKTMDELGDFLFCVLGNTELADKLTKRMEFNIHRAKVYAILDQKKLKDPEFCEQVKGLKFTQGGWVGIPLPHSLMTVLLQIESTAHDVDLSVFGGDKCL